MNVSARDILKNVVTALIIALITYSVNTGIEIAFKRFEVSFQRTVIMDKPGVLFQFDNATSKVFETVKIGIARRISIDNASADNGVTVETALSTASTSVALNNLPPHRRTNVFVATMDQLQQSELSVIYDGQSYQIEDGNYEAISIFNLSNAINTAFLFAGYMFVSLWARSQFNQVRQKLDAASSETEKRREDNNRKAEKLQNDLKNLEMRDLRMRLILQRRIIHLLAENDMWRMFFIAIYKRVFSSTENAEVAMDAICKRLGLNHNRRRRIGDIPEDDFLDMLFNEKTEGKLKLP